MADYFNIYDRDLQTIKGRLFTVLPISFNSYIQGCKSSINEFLYLGSKTFSGGGCGEHKGIHG